MSETETWRGDEIMRGTEEMTVRGQEGSFEDTAAWALEGGEAKSGSMQASSRNQKR